MALLFLIQSSLIWFFQSHLKSRQSQLKQKTYSLLKNVHTWDALSNNTPGDDESASNSLEAIHDSIHVSVGGHMGDSAVAGRLSHATEFLGNA